MQARAHRDTATPRLLMALLVAGACFAVAAPSASSGERQPALSGQTHTGSGESGSKQPGEKPAAAPGMIIYIDPQTGALLKEPAPGAVPLQLTPELQNALSTSDRGLVEVPSSVPGGGIKLDLQGRFQSPLFATTDANGNVKIQHLPEMPGAADKK